MKKKENALKKPCKSKRLTEVNFFESNKYFKYSWLGRTILLTDFRKGFGKIDFILTP